MHGQDRRTVAALQRLGCRIDLPGQPDRLCAERGFGDLLGDRVTLGRGREHQWPQLSLDFGLDVPAVPA
nr:hypothetical protein [Rhodococcus sp. 06-418-1B]